MDSITRFRDWMGQRLERQIAVRAALITFVTATLLSLVAVGATVGLLRAQQRQSMDLRASGVEHSVSEQLRRTVAEVESLSRNPLVTTALLDSAGRRAYLEPFLRTFQIPGLDRGALTLCDFNGEALAVNGSVEGLGAECFGARPEFRRLFDDDRPTAFLSLRAEELVVVLLQPVIYPNSGRAEGAFAAVLRPEGLLASVRRLSPTSRIALHAGLEGEQDTPVDVVTHRRLQLEGTLGALNLTLHISEPLDLWGPVVWSLAAYTFVTLLILLVVAPLALHSGRRLAQPLREIAEAARKIAEQGAATEVHLPRRSDEVGVVATAIGSMLAALRAGQENLEAQVRERTGELSDSLSTLALAERNLRQREAELRGAQSVAHIGSWKLDIAEKILEWSDETNRIFGVEPGAPLSYERFLACVHPDDREAVDRAWQAALKGDRYDIEHRILANGQLRWVREQADLHFDEAGQLSWGIGTVHDITDRKLAEEAIQESKALYESLVASLPQYLYRIDRAGRLTFVGDALLQSLGVPLDQVLGKTAYDLYPPELAARYRADDEEVIRTGRTLNRVEPHRYAATGNAGFVEVVKIPVRNTQGQVVGIQGIFWDVTERENAAILLEVQRDLANALASPMTEGELMAAILAGALRLPELDAGIVYRGCPDGGFELVEQRGLSPGFVARSKRLEPGSRRVKIIRRGRVICSCTSPIDHCTDPELIRSPYLAEEGLTALVVLPIKLEGEVIGCLSLGAKGSGSISRETLFALEALAAQFGATLERWRSQVELAHRRENLLGLFETIDDLLFVLDTQGRIRHHNHAVTKLLGYPEGSLLGRPATDVHPPEAREEALRTIADMLAGTRRICPIPLLRADGGQIMVETRVVPGTWDGEPALFGISRDIRERLEAEAQLRLAANVFNHSHEGILITDVEGRIVEANAAFSAITGYSHDEVLGRNPNLLSSGRHDPEFYRRLWQELTEQGQWQGEIWNRRKDGVVFAELLNISAVKDQQGRTTHYVAIFVDITLQKQYQEHLEELAHFDPLTGLPNRVLLADRIRLAMAQTRRAKNRLAVCFLDLDGFKGVNDSLGHDAGDELLRIVSGRLKEAVRGGDTVARLGGDEFALLLGGLQGREECGQALERVLERIALPYEIKGREVRVSASIGVTLFPDDHLEPDQLLRQADQAMYLAKQAGKNRYRFFSSAGGA